MESRAKGIRKALCIAIHVTSTLYTCALIHLINTCLCLCVSVCLGIKLNTGASTYRVGGCEKSLEKVYTYCQHYLRTYPFHLI